jgi:rhodanese-related sulfurtransferase
MLKYLWKYKKNKKTLSDLSKNGAIIIDVRSKEEFRSNSLPNSLNIPLDDLKNRIHEIDKNKIIILCCATGARSGLAVPIFKKNGFHQVFNAGKWQNLFSN